MNQQAKMPNTKEYNLFLKIRINPSFHRVGVPEENDFRVIFMCEGCGTPRSNRGSVLKVGETGPDFKCKKGCRGGSATVLQARNCWMLEEPGVKAAVVIPNAHDAAMDGVLVRVELIEYEFRRIN